MLRTFSHLNLSDRIFIEEELLLGTRPAAIALALGRSRSTISREMRRNGWRGNLREGSKAGGYRCIAADRRARVLAHKPRQLRKLQPGNELWKLMVGHLERGLSPAEISGTLAEMADPVFLSYETIYTALYAMPRGQLRRELLNTMRREHKKRRPGRANRRSKSIPDMTLIDHRPSEVTERLVPGHWEGDLIIGKGNLSQVGTLVERSTLFVALVKLPDGKAKTVAKRFGSILKRFKSQMRRSLTYDQGSEMSQHKALAKDANIDVYFAHPHSPWERGISENTNGLLRDYLPKGTDLSVHSQQQLDEMAWQLNTRIRKSLGWKAPAELFLPKGAFNFQQYWSKENSEKLRRRSLYRPHLRAARLLKSGKQKDPSHFPTARGERRAIE